MNVNILRKIILISLILILVISSAVLFAGCGEEEKPVYKVKLVYSTFGETIEVTEGEVIAPKIKSYFREKAWYTSKDGNLEWNIYKDGVVCDMTLYARASE